MKIYSHIRMLSLLVAVSFLSFSVRVGELVVGLSASGTAFAQPEVKEVQEGEAAASPPPLPAVVSEKAEGQMPDLPALPETAGKAADSKDSKATAAEGGEKKADVAQDAAAGTKSDKEAGKDTKETAAADEKDEKKDKNWRDAGDTDIEYSAAQEGLYKDLAARRAAIESQEKQLATREALLRAAERELDQKLQELTTIRGEIEGLLKKQSDEENARILSLVKIYEGMKPKDAARIFNTLDLDVLITVLTHMSEKKSGLIMAEMTAERAQTVTIMLAQQKQLPALPVQ